MKKTNEMREIIQTNEFKRQLKLAKKRGKDLQKLVDIVEKLQKDEILSEHKNETTKHIFNFHKITPSHCLTHPIKNNN